MNKKSSVIAIILFVLSGSLLIYSIWSMNFSASYISEAIEYGQVSLSTNLYEIVNYIVGAFSSYFLFAVLFAVIGWQLLPARAKRPDTDEDTDSAEKNAGDEWSALPIEEDAYAKPEISEDDANKDADGGAVDAPFDVFFDAPAETPVGDAEKKAGENE